MELKRKSRHCHKHRWNYDDSEQVIYHFHKFFSTELIGKFSRATYLHFFGYLDD